MNTSKGCGCGGSGAGGCGCGGASSKPMSWGCSACGGRGCGRCRGGAFIRPNFFGGQLLTEDDLQALVQFVIDKNRLHNRALFGAGVVCGLEVACDPCDPKKLVLAPGYALDCCGNDIVVSCPESVNVMQLIQELRAKLLKVDCGDPCKKPPAGCADETSESQPEEAPSTGNEGDRGKPVPRPRREPCEEYCLYIKYCEQEAEPVAPYTTDDCGPSGCKPTRIYEGFELELRCVPRPKQKPTRTSRAHDCLGDDREIKKVLDRAILLQLIWRPVFDAATQYVRSPEAEVTLPPLGQAVDRIHSFASIKDPTHAQLAKALQSIVTIGAHHTRGAGDDKERKLELAKAFESEPMHKAAELIRRHLKTIDDPLLATWGHEIVTHISAGKQFQPGSLEHEMLSRGAFVTAPMMQAAVAPIRDLRGWIAVRATTDGQTHCTNAQRAAASALTVSDVTKMEPYSVLEYARAAHEISILTSDEARRCACDAINPPCTPCDDPAVLLACITVIDCKVVTICNSVRDYVLTGPNLRYWMPTFDRFFERSRALCCGDGCASEYASFAHLRETVLTGGDLFEGKVVSERRADTAALLRLIPGLPAEQPSVAIDVVAEPAHDTIARLQRELAALTEQVKLLTEAAPKRKNPSGGGG